MGKASQHYINYCSKKNPYYCYLLYFNLKYRSKSFLHKVIMHKPVFVPLSYEGKQYACVCMLVVIIWWWNKPAKQSTFKPIWLITHFYILLINLLIAITFLYRQVFFRLVKETNETTNLWACFFYNTSLSYICMYIYVHIWSHKLYFSYIHMLKCLATIFTHMYICNSKVFNS